MTTNASAAADADTGRRLEGSRWPYVLGAGIGLVLIVVYELTPESSQLQPGEIDIRVGRYFSLMIGYWIAVSVLIARAGARDARRIRGISASRCAALQREVRRPRLVWLVGCCLVGCSLHIAILSIVGVPIDRVLDPDSWPVRRSFSFALGWIHIFCLSGGLSLIFSQGVDFMRIARELPEPDLVDYSELAPFVRVALRFSLVLAVSFGLGMALHFDWSAGVMAPQMALILPVATLFLVLSFVFPLWGVHERLRDARRDELRRVHAALRGEHAALLDSPLLREDEKLGTVELLAYRAQIQSLATWPVDSSSAARLAMYLGIPLAGWIGGALVERLLDALLD